MKPQDTIRDIHRRLAPHGVTFEDCATLRRIAMTLHRWHEMECGDANGNAIERDDVTGKPYRTWDRGNHPRGRYPMPDRERGALARLATVMARYPTLRAYVQGDPRGLPLYILPQDADDDHYHRGVGVGK